MAGIEIGDAVEELRDGRAYVIGERWREGRRLTGVTGLTGWAGWTGWTWWMGWEKRGRRGEATGGKGTAEAWRGDASCGGDDGWWYGVRTPEARVPIIPQNTPLVGGCASFFFEGVGGMGSVGGMGAMGSMGRMGRMREMGGGKRGGGVSFGAGFW